MSLFNTKIMTIKREAIGDYTTSADGSYTPGTAVPDFTITGTWQPSLGSEQEVLPEGKRSSDVYKLYTSTELQVVDPLTQKRGDQIVSPLNAQIYDLYKGGEYQNELIPHYKYLAVRVKESE